MAAWSVPPHEPLDDDVRIMGSGADREIGWIFFVPDLPRASYYDKIRPCKSEVILYQDGEAIFLRTGQVKPEQGFDSVEAITERGN